MRDNERDPSPLDAYDRLRQPAQLSQMYFVVELVRPWMLDLIWQELQTRHSLPPCGVSIVVDGPLFLGERLGLEEGEDWGIHTPLWRFLHRDAIPVLVTSNREISRVVHDRYEDGGVLVRLHVSLLMHSDGCIARAQSERR